MKNKIEDLRNHLFAELERLGDESLTGDALKEEIQRARSVSDVSAQVVETARVENDRLKITRCEPASEFIQLSAPENK